MQSALACTHARSTNASSSGPRAAAVRIAGGGGGGAGSAALRCSPQLLLAPSRDGAEIMPRQDKAQNSAELFSETCPSSLLLLRFQWRFAQQLAADGRPGPCVKRAHEARLPSLSLQACRV